MFRCSFAPFVVGVESLSGPVFLICVWRVQIVSSWENDVSAYMAVAKNI